MSEEKKILSLDELAAQDLWSEVIADMKRRRELGLERYSRPLSPFDQRDSSQDLREELLDALVYLLKLDRELDAICAAWLTRGFPSGMAELEIRMNRLCQARGMEKKDS